MSELITACFDDEIIELETESFKITDDYKAEWALKKVAEIDTEYSRYSNVCQLYIDSYQQKAAKAKVKRDNERGHLVALLAEYFETIKSKATKTQATYKLPSGKLIKKFEKQVLEHDEAMLIKALADTEYVELKPNLKWGEYKKTLRIINDTVVDEDGVIVDGVSIGTKPASFDVEAE